MDVKEFTAAYREAFGERPELPLLFRYTDTPLRPVEKVGGCFFKALAEARRGLPVSLNAGNIGCGGGKFYTGFSPMPEFVPQFVSLKERYKRTPEMVLEFIAALDLRPAPKAWLEFVRADVAETFDGAEGVLFFAAPDALAGLVTWATFDNNAADAVASPFGSGCSSVVAQAVQEPQRRQEVFSGPFRSVGTPVGGTGCFELRRSDVPLSGDVRHDACKLSVRYACVEQSSRTD